MSRALANYREMETKLRNLRTESGGKPSAKETELLDQMDDVWYAMAPAERAELAKEPSIIPDPTNKDALVH